MRQPKQNSSVGAVASLMNNHSGPYVACKGIFSELCRIHHSGVVRRGMFDICHNTNFTAQTTMLYMP